MSNELRVRTNFVGGLIEDNPLASGATTLTSAGLASLPAITSTSHMAIILDPDGRAGNPEIAYVTAHTALATTATITKGQEGTTGRAHDRDTPWTHGPTIKDFDASGGGSGLIGLTNYNPTTSATPTVTSTSYVDIDATNLVVAFIGPPSGRVLLRLSALASNTGAVPLRWNVRDSLGDVTDSDVYATASSAAIRVQTAVEMLGLTPGTAYSWKWGWKVPSSTGNLFYGKSSVFGPAIMEVLAVNL